MTAWARRWSEFPIVWGRMIMPVALGCAAWTAYNAWVVLTGRGLGTLLDGTTGLAIGLVSAVVSVMLVAGWVLRLGSWMRQGMLLTACLLVATSVTILAETGVGNISAFYNVPWAVLVGTSWLIEVRDKRPERH